MAEQLDWLGDLEEDTRRQELPDDDKTRSLESLARQYEETEEAIARAEEAVSQLQKQLRTIREDLLPDKMIEFGVKKLILSDGSELSYKPFYGGKILSPDAYDWLESSGYGEAVKQELNLSTSRVDKETLERVKKLLEVIPNANVSIREKVSIHHMTLSSLIKDLTKAGKQLPSDLIEVYIGNIATLRGAKK